MEKIEQVAQEYIAAKNAEEVARERRYAAERQLSELMGSKAEGQITATAGRYKVTAKHKVNRTLDVKKWNEIKDQIEPAIADNLIRYKASLDLKGYRWIEENRPDVFDLVSEVVTRKPAQVGFTIMASDSWLLRCPPSPSSVERTASRSWFTARPE